MTNLRLAIMTLALSVLIALGWRAAHREPAPEPPIIVTVAEPIVTVTEPAPAPTPPAAIEPPAATKPKPFRRKAPPTDSAAPPLRRPTDTAAPPPRVARKSPEADPPGWTLPYSCSRVRWYSTHFSETALEAMRVAAGMAKPTDDQLRQIKACLAQK